VRDINHDGIINNGSELFDVATVLANGQRAGNVYATMAALDSNNHDVKLSAADAAWSELKVWVDANRDGKVDPGELKALAEVGVLSINLDFTKGTTVNNGNLLGLVSSYTSTDGTQHAVADVWFAKARSDPKAAPPALSPLLAGASTDPVPAAAASSTPAAVHQAQASPQAAAIPMSLRRSTLDEELLRHQLPIV
jgi:hypothetical protein